MHNLLRDAIILDTETLGLKRGSGIYELATFDVNSGVSRQYDITPSRVVSSVSNAQDLAKLVSSSADKHVLEKADYWRDVIAANAGLRSMTPEQLMQHLEAEEEFLATALKGRAAHLLTGAQAPGLQRPAGLPDALWKVRQSLQSTTSMEELLAPGSDFDKSVKGKTIWIANAPFEAKQVGAYTGAIEAMGGPVGLRDHLETQNPRSADMLYVTGAEVNQARVTAQLTGDWTPVWKAMNQHMPKQGETAVRDILDVTRAMHSYAQKMQLMKPGDTYFGVGIDLSFRLFGSTEADPKTAQELLMFSESHTAAGDASISENYVLKRSTEMTQAMQDVYEGNAAGKQLLAEAGQGRGPFYQAQQYFQRLGHLQPSLQATSLVQRLGRAQEDLLTEGVTYHTEGFNEISDIVSKTPDGGKANVRIARHARREMRDMQSVVQHLIDSGRYGDEATVNQAWESMSKLGTTTEVRQHVAQYTRDNVSRVINQEASNLMSMRPSASRFTAGSGMPSMVTGAMQYAGNSKNLSILAATAVVGSVLGLAVGSRPERENPSMVTHDFQSWQAEQEYFFGLKQQSELAGLANTGVAERTRKQNTDFGSPYRGPVVSDSVLADQELLSAREDYLRQQYGIRHFDPNVGLFGIDGPYSKYKQYLPSGHRYINSGQMLSDPQSMGLRGKQLVQINANDGWKIEVEDADTVMLSRGGMRGAISSFFGMNEQYKFRMEGIDSTETWHSASEGGGRAYNTPQPYADTAADVLRQMIDGKDVSLVIDPTNITYGRQVGVVFADGMNINKELIARGAAAHLDYHKMGSQSMLNAGSLSDLESRAARSQRGMWAEPWAAAFYDYRGQNGITFNTLARVEKIAEKQSLINAVTLMQEAQANGVYDTQMRQRVQAESVYFNTHKDDVTAYLTRKAPAHYKNYMDEMLRDMSEFSGTKGTGNPYKSYSSKSGYGKLDKHLAIDTLGTTTSVMTLQRSSMQDRYPAMARKQRMQAEQQAANRTMFNSPIGHYRM